ncbi:MAG: OmpL47-type beta-barrel domain-containing protein [Dehalococcoidia bacterium]
MRRQLTWQAVLIFALSMAALIIGSAARTPNARASAISATITIDNQGDLDLFRAASPPPDHGCNISPPDSVAAHTTATFVAESCGAGVEGTVFYLPNGAPDGKTMRYYWDVPVTCCNTAQTDAPAGCTSFQSKLIDGGDHPDVTFASACVSSAGDGIADVWKRNGASFNGGAGKQFIDLPSMGANVNRKQIFLQIDWMQDATHNQKLDPATLTNLRRAFGNQNIDIIIDQGSDSVMHPVTQLPWGAALSKARALPYQDTLGATSAGVWDWTQFDAIKNGPGGFKESGRRAIFHYVIAAHAINASNTSGISHGSDIVVSLGAGWTGSTGSVNEQTGTLMHELGHNLGLGHGGTDKVNWKPNYLSVMNYLFQTSGVTRGGANSFDYSTAALGNLDETALNEANGIGVSAATSHWCPGSGGNRGAYVAVADGSKPIDWNCNGTIDGGVVSADVNGDSICVEPGADGTLDTAKAGDDAVTGAQILAGGDRKCETTVTAGDDGGPGSNIADFVAAGAMQPNPLLGASDWDKLQLKGGAIGGNGGEPPGLPTVQELHDLTPAAQRDILPLDTTPPVTIESATPAPNGAGWNNADVTVTLTATDDISGVARTEYNLDGGGWTQYTAPVTISAEAVHTFLYRSIDRSQNVETAKSATIKLDKTPPTVGLTGFTPNGQHGWFTSKSAAGGVIASDGLSGLKSIACTDDLGGLSPTSLAPGGAVSATLALTITSDGVHHITCTATDVADNTSPAAALTVKVDSTPPVCTAVANPNSLWPPNHKLVDVNVSLTASDGGSGLQSFTGVKPASNEDMADIAANVTGLNVPTNAGSTNGQQYSPALPDSTGPPSYAGTASGQVREERDGGGSGRTYTLIYTATDMAGNVGTCAATVVVAHDQGH